jgi:hypothetical protein
LGESAPAANPFVVSERVFTGDVGIDPCVASEAVMSVRSAGIVSGLAAGVEMAFASSIGVGPIADATCVNVNIDIFAFFTGSFFVDVPCPATDVASACDFTGTAELFFFALCKVLAKSLAPCPWDCRGRAALLGEPDDPASVWIMLVSTKFYFSYCNPVNACGTPKARASAFAYAIPTSG